MHYWQKISNGRKHRNEHNYCYVLHRETRNSILNSSIKSITWNFKMNDMNQMSETWYKYTVNVSSSFMSILFHNLKVWVWGVFFFLSMLFQVLAPWKNAFSVFFFTFLVIYPCPIKVWVLTLLWYSGKCWPAAAFFGQGQAVLQLTFLLCPPRLFKMKLRAVKGVGRNSRRLLENSKITAPQLLK